jgi:hypothetical protein
VELNGAITREHVKLCLRLVLHAHLHQLEAGLTHQKVVELCSMLDMNQEKATHAERLDALQVRAAQLLPMMT